MVLYMRINLGSKAPTKIMFYIYSHINFNYKIFENVECIKLHYIVVCYATLCYAVHI